MINRPEMILEIEALKNHLGDHWVHNDLNLSVKRGEIIAIIGGSGCGKTTLMRTILMLRAQTAGTIKVFGMDTAKASHREKQMIRRRWGVMFQHGALFSSLSLLDNIIFPLQQFTALGLDLQKQTAMLKIIMSGLEPEAARKYPAELSGGMLKRASMARAIVLDPELVFLDEPTAGLDPKSAGELDHLVLQLRDNLGITFVMITHDLDTLWKVPDRVVFLGDGQVLAALPMAEMVKQTHPLIQKYFSGERSKVRNG